VVDHVVTLAGATWAALAEPDGAWLVMATTTAGSPLRDQRVAIGGESSALALVFQTGEARLIPDVAGAGSPASRRMLSLARATRSVYTLPVEVRGQVAGVLIVGWDVPVVGVTERRATLVALAAHEAGIALERLATLRRLERLAVTDPLTELGNRRVWERELPLAMARTRRSGSTLAVAALDLNQFKVLNDTCGHAAGDRLLQRCARGWLEVLRGPDLLVRFGGDEFAALLPDCDDVDAVIARLKAAAPHAAGVAVGIAVWDGVESPDALLRRADVALYADKAASRRS
jgi:diguanylate cyclase (GGDEF)-like protein